jgi:hypothetical protein
MSGRPRQPCNANCGISTARHVSLLMSIKTIVEAAAIAAGSTVQRFAVPIPGMGQQARFKAAMAEIIPTLPRLPDAC